MANPYSLCISPRLRGGGGRGKTLGQKLAGIVEQGKFFRALCLK